MKIKTSELTGAALDWAVAKCEGFDLINYRQYLEKRVGELYARATAPESEYRILRKGGSPLPISCYSTDWSQGGPIIDREKIKSHYAGPMLEWECWCSESGYGIGPTLLIAAMRCYVASKMGDEIEIPDELV